MVDLEYRDEGTVVVLRPVTEAAQAWIDENIISEGWQWLGNTLAVDHRYADAVLNGAQDAGLVVERE